MKFGIREICDVVFKAKANMKVGNKVFYKGEPVIYFDSLKTSTLEGAATTVYATGGKGNARLMAWEGEKTLTFTMEDALISPIGISILAGAELIESGAEQTIYVHATEITNKVTKDTNNNNVTIELDQVPAKQGEVYVMLMENGSVISEPYIGTVNGTAATVTIAATENYAPKLEDIETNATVLVDYYVAKTTSGAAQQIDITPDKFGGNFYIEGSTLFRDQATSVDMPAEIIIPNGKVQSNFSFAMASSGDPSTFTFTVDALADYTKFDTKKKVLAAIQTITEEVGTDVGKRVKTPDGDSIINTPEVDTPEEDAE